MPPRFPDLDIVGYRPVNQLGFVQEDIQSGNDTGNCMRAIRIEGNTINRKMFVLNNFRRRDPLPGTLTLILHVRLNYMMAYLGVVNMHDQTKVRFVAFMALIIRFEAKLRHFFASVKSS